MNEPAGSVPRASERRVLSLLLAAYVFNFLDRQLLAILKIPIKAELGLTDTQLGLMGGIAFAGLYSTLAIPFARVADRRGRVGVIALSVSAWSVATALFGAASSFVSLFAARMLVGIGEAGGVAPSYALIADTVAPDRRARALAIFSLGIPIGSALGLFFGGWIATALNWRWAFVILGLAGLPLALALWRWVPEPPRPRSSIESPAETGLLSVFGRLARKPAFWFLSLGAASASIAGYGLGFWLPSYFHDSLGLPLAGTGNYFGVIVLVGGVAGIWGGGAVADRLAKARVAAYAWVPAMAFVVTGPLYGLALSSSSLAVAMPLYTLAYAGSLTWLGPVVAGVQRLVPATMRATASACLLLIVNLLGLGAGTFLFGFAKDRLTPLYGGRAMYLSLLGGGLLFYMLAALLMALAAGRLAADSAGD